MLNEHEDFPCEELDGFLHDDTEPAAETSPVELPQNWYFTFGFGHAHPNGYVCIFGTHDGAREEMFRHYGPKWSFQYDEVRFLPQIERYNLYQVHVD